MTSRATNRNVGRWSTANLKQRIQKTRLIHPSLSALLASWSVSTIMALLPSTQHIRYWVHNSRVLVSVTDVPVQCFATICTARIGNYTFYILPTCFLRISQQTATIFVNITNWTETQCHFCGVRTEFLNNSERDIQVWRIPRRHK
jgi:hypothetical protein